MRAACALRRRGSCLGCPTACTGTGLAVVPHTGKGPGQPPRRGAAGAPRAPSHSQGPGGHARTGAWPSSAAMSVMAWRCSSRTSLTVTLVPLWGMSNTSTVPEDVPAGGPHRRCQWGRVPWPSPQLLLPGTAAPHTSSLRELQCECSPPGCPHVSPFHLGPRRPPGVSLPCPPPPGCPTSLTHADEAFSSCRDPSGKHSLCWKEPRAGCSLGQPTGTPGSVSPPVPWLPQGPSSLPRPL